MPDFRVNEIFESIQGETTHAGRPCLFVRFTGCDLRCRYCDTRYAYEGGELWEAEAVLDRLRHFRSRFVTLTGGEPMLQPALPELCQMLIADGFEVAIETHGQRPLGALPIEVRRIVDLKTPGSGSEDTRLLNLADLRATDELKIVVTSRADFDWARQIVERFELDRRGLPIVFSPCFGEVAPRDLVAWLLDSGLDARIGLQLHKVIWDPGARGV
ncbi:MAG: 7-carboxy-7-deazaguanine synthase QueE [Myxococcales bacterium]|jgi:7-carboxy-7-deazaguanine synthase|nr:7-carboxy-7-deazaguanine synthase QueE [Myxococcales bacterium]